MFLCQLGLGSSFAYAPLGRCCCCCLLPENGVTVGEQEAHAGAGSVEAGALHLHLYFGRFFRSLELILKEIKQKSKPKAAVAEVLVGSVGRGGDWSVVCGVESHGVLWPPLQWSHK